MKPVSLIVATLVTLSGPALAANGTATDERIVSFDYGSLDTLDALNLGQQVVGVPKQGLPDYLSEYGADAYTDVGGLKTPDLDAIRQASPTLILITGRQGEQRDALEAIAPVTQMGVSGEDYLQAFDSNVMTLAERLDVASQAQSALDSLHQKIESARQKTDGTKDVLTVTHNDGNYMLNNHPVIYGVLGVSEPQIPASVPTETRGTRTFTPLSPVAIGEIDPDVILIVDRSAAIGNDGVDVEALRQALANGAAAEADIEVLTPRLWYLSGGGLQSLGRQIDEVANAL